MRRGLLPALAAVAALALVSPAAASERHPTQNELENEIMCPVCEGETLAESDSPAAQQVEAVIRQKIHAGWTKSRIKRFLAAEYGEQILAAPSRHGFNLLAWALPLVGILGAALVLGVLAWRWSRVREPGAGGSSLGGRPLDPDLERRVDDELTRFEA
ncbi:MAG: cytochrome c-type biogenesis protein CcmH [Actinomycetota bacterium]|nr:cytochrome c-type biogenesis protein CcmH [Actinomycetota bacterium]